MGLFVTDTVRLNVIDELLIAQVSKLFWKPVTSVVTSQELLDVLQLETADPLDEQLMFPLPVRSTVGLKLPRTKSHEKELAQVESPTV